MTLNKLGKKLIQACGCSVERHWGTNEYDSETQTIYIHELNDTFMAKSIKRKYGRPTNPSWSWYHELGHAIYDIFSLEHDEKVWEVFGDFNEEYGGEKDLQESRYYEDIPDYVTKYAQAHPEEDWAETVAELITNNGIPKGVRNKQQKKKFKLAWSWINTILKDHG